MASRCPSWPQLGGSWRHLGSKLAPSWPISARFWSIRARPKLTKIGQDSFWDIFCLKVAPKSSQTPSRPWFFKFSGPFFKGFRQFFGTPFDRFCFKVYSFSKHLFFNFLWERASRKVPKGGGGGTRPQGVFDDFQHLFVYLNRWSSFLCAYMWIHKLLDSRLQ